VKQWKLVKAVPGMEAVGEGRDPFPYLVEELDDQQCVIRNSTRRYTNAEGAMDTAEALNKQGCNVRVSLELAFCINVGDDT
jgi:hypothetical protein